jgi:cytochrome c2
MAGAMAGAVAGLPPAASPAFAEDPCLAGKDARLLESSAGHLRALNMAPDAASSSHPQLRWKSSRRSLAMRRRPLTRSSSILIAALACAIGVTACAQNEPMETGAQLAAADGPADQGPPLPQNLNGDLALGQQVFRFETFGNEGFWTDAVRLPAGMMEKKVTPYQALQLGLQVDVDAVDPAMKAQLAEQLRRDPSGKTSSIMNDPAVTMALVKANAVIGMSPRNGKVGASCAMCHAITDASVFRAPNGGSIGKRVDGPGNPFIDVGAIFATAANSRALYPVLQLKLAANKGKTIGRGSHKGLDENSTEAEVDAYLMDKRSYPVGMFDDSFDGNGNPMHNSPLFEQDLAAPYGTEGTLTKIEDFSNLVFTTLFDQTMLTTPGGRAFVNKLAGPAGDEMINDYVRILRETGVTGYPFVTRQAQLAGMPGTLETPIGFRVDNRSLLAMNAYLAALTSPPGDKRNPQAIARGREVFRTSGCTGCHNVDPRAIVPTTIHPMARIFPGDRPMVLAPRTPPLNPVVNTMESIFDDKMAVVNASIRGEKRGIGLPLLLDLARKDVFLHDDSVKGLEQLFNPSRGRNSPHPFFLTDARRRATWPPS